MIARERIASGSSIASSRARMEIVYAAHTRSGVFMLDQDGVCRWAVAQPGHTAEKVPERIVGAQYLATLDVDAEGALVDLPRIGCPMLFAATDEGGRVRLVRTPPLLRFEDRRNAPMRRPLASKFEVDGSAAGGTSRTPYDGSAAGGTSRAFEVEPATTPTPTPRMARAYDEEATPIGPLSSYVAELAPRRSSSIPPPPSMPESESMPVPLMRQTTGMRPTAHTPAYPMMLPARTPLPPPPRARIAARIPPAPSGPLSATGSGLRASPSSPGVQSIPVRTRSANLSLKKLARGK